MKTVDVQDKPYIHPTDGKVDPKTFHRDRRKILTGYQEITCHLAFDIKLDGNFTHKARFVGGGYKTKAPESLLYSSVVFQDSIRIDFLVISLNNLNLSTCDISVVYLNAPYGKEVWFEAGSEFVSNAGKVMAVICTLCGLKSSSKAWRILFTLLLKYMGYKPCIADPDVYKKMKAKFTKDRHKYWSYMLVHVENYFFINSNPYHVMNNLKIQ